MPLPLADAIAELKKDPSRTVLADVDGWVVELRVERRPTADDVFREIGPWEGESAEDLMRLLRETRGEGGSKEPARW